MAVRTRSLAAAAAVWLAVVAGGSALAWLAIDRAGRQVLMDGGAVVNRALATASSAGPVTPSPSAPPAPTRTAKPSGDDPSQAPVRPSPATRPAPSATTVPQRAPARAATTPPTRPAPAHVDRTVRVHGGIVGARCTGSAISLRFAQPDDGWTATVTNPGPEELEVELRAGPGHEGDSTVHGACVGGAPRFEGDGSGD